MLTRVISAVVGITVILLFVYWGGVFFIGLAMLLSLLAAIELGRILKRMGIVEMKPFLYVGAVLFPLLLSFEPAWLPNFLSLFVFSGAIIFLSKLPDAKIEDLALNFLSLLYVSFGFAHFILLRQMEQGMLLAFYAFAVVWLTDIGSFYIGTYLGKRPFFDHISPNKTLEGAVGGLICGFVGGLVACVVINCMTPMDNMGFLIFLAPFLSAAGQMGDLFESSLKRQSKTKDSSQLIPGHGGILDRFDGALWIFPLLYHILQIRMNIFL